VRNRAIATVVGAALSLAVWSSASNARGDDGDDRPPAVATWKHGDPVPEGYRAVRKHALTKLGGALLVGSYAFAVAVHFTLLLTCSSAFDRFMGGTGSTPTCNPAPSSTWPLLIPLAGPWVTLASTNVNYGTVFWLSLSGAGQIAGATVLAYSFLAPQYKLVPLYRAMIAPAPIGDGGLMVSGRF
jgi:hypothetical protein